MADERTGLLRRLLRRSPVSLPESLEIDGRPVPILIREHAAARRIVMRISACGTALRLTVPRRTPARTVLAFLDRHSGWAGERLAAASGGIRVADGAEIPFRGGTLRIRADPVRRQTSFVWLTGGAGAELLVGGEAAHLPRRVKDFVIREARRDLEAAVARHAAAAKVRPAGIALRDTASRWGSCSTTRRLSFSWRIVLAPPAVLDYLAAHEVAHLREMNHGPAFWALCRELCPQMDAQKVWLKREGGRLHRIDFG